MTTRKPQEVSENRLAFRGCGTSREAREARRPFLCFVVLLFRRLPVLSFLRPGIASQAESRTTGANARCRRM